MTPDEMGMTGGMPEQQPPPPPPPPSGSIDMAGAAAKLKGATGADRMILVAALALLIDSFLPWYGAGLSFGETSVSFNANAWDVGGLALLSVLCGVASGALAAARVLGWRAPIGGLKDGMLYLILGAGAGGFALLRLLTETSFTKFGIFLAILLGAALAYAGWMKYKAEA